MAKSLGEREMDIEVVIGANYGDEGKGLFTEHLCRNRPNPLVVLSNGGCQRGHTVNNVEKGIRHVFHHFGSGTLVGAPSVFAKTYLLNPIAYVEEKRELEKFGIEVKSYRAPSCVVQLPGDMFTNQTIENARAKHGLKHGSCGWGIWETIVRNNRRPLTFEEFAALDYEAKRQRILEEVEHQFTWRLRGVDDSAIDYDVLETLMSEGFVKHFIDDFEEMAKTCKLLESDDLLHNDYGKCIKTFVVENAQGLLLDTRYAPLDENGRTDIHTTPSKCGLNGVLEALGEGAIDKPTTANYISRTYLTRHGAGPFPEEDSSMAFVDNTNVKNPYQGKIRFGKMTEKSIDELCSRIDIDLGGYNKDKTIRHHIVLTHCNEVPPNPALLSRRPCILSFSDNSKDIMPAKMELSTIASGFQHKMFAMD